MRQGKKTSKLFKSFGFLILVALVFLGVSFLKSDSTSLANFSGIAEKIKNYCASNSAVHKGEENCYADKMEEIAEQNGPEYTFKVLDELQRIDPDAIGCHLISHGIGWGSYKKEPSRWRELVQNMRTTCNYGAIHGVIEGYISNLPEKSLSREVIPTICGEAPRADCNHIVGHLLLVQTETDVDKALQLCTVFVDKQQRDFCITGVYMEYQTALNLVSHDLVPESWLNWPPRLPELEKLCRKATGENAVGCWKEIAHVALAKFNNDPKKVFEFCDSSPVPEGGYECKVHSIGIIGGSRNFDLLKLKDVCSYPQKNDPNFEENCYPHLISSTLSTIPEKVGEAIAFCSGLAVKFKPSCFSMIGSVSFAIPPVKELGLKECPKVPVEYRDYCLGLKHYNSNVQYVPKND